MKTFVKKHTLVESYCAEGIGACPELEAPFGGMLSLKITCEAKPGQDPMVLTIGEHIPETLFISPTSSNAQYNFFALSFLSIVKAGNIISILPTENGRIHTWVIDYLEKETGNG